MKTVKDLTGEWTLLWDMHSGGLQKTQWHFIVIQASKDDAIKYANWKWGINPSHVTCNCCGEDYNVYHDTMPDVIAYNFVPFQLRIEHHTDELAYKMRMQQKDPWLYLISRDEVSKQIAIYISDGQAGKFLFVFRDEMGEEWIDQDVSWVDWESAYEEVSNEND